MTARRRRPGWGASLVLGTCALLLAACSEETIVLATIAADDGGGPPTRCVSTADCPDETICDTGDCAATVGTCIAQPQACFDPREAPECGCDGVMYFNDCLRRAAGVRGATAGDCRTATTRCGGPAGGTCPGSTVCGVLLGFHQPRMCSAHEEGQCWMVPFTCPTPAPGLGLRWDECGGAGTCVDTCNAVKSGRPYLATSSTTCP